MKKISNFTQVLTVLFDTGIVSHDMLFEARLWLDVIEEHLL